MDDELYEVPDKVNRQREIEVLPIGETVSITRRIDLTFGIDPAKLSEHAKLLRGPLDQQAYRARRKHKHHEYKVENGRILTSDGALLLVAAVTRVA